MLDLKPVRPAVRPRRAPRVPEWFQRLMDGYFDPGLSGARDRSLFLAVILVVAVFSGATASVVGFGIGSLLTPLLALRFGTGVAVAAVSIPRGRHRRPLLAATRRERRPRRAPALRPAQRARQARRRPALCAPRRRDADPRPRRRCSLMTGVAQLTGWSRRWRPRGPWVATLRVRLGVLRRRRRQPGRPARRGADRVRAGAGGLRRHRDRHRPHGRRRAPPIYVWRAGSELARGFVIPIGGVATVGVLVGTVFGERILLGLSPARFATLVGAAIESARRVAAVRRLSRAPVSSDRPALSRARRWRATSRA